MKFKDFRQYFSSSRINRYLIATGNSNSRATALYKANLKVAQSFHPLLGVLEVVIRNRINDILTAHFTDPDWIINQKTGFMIDPSLRFTDRRGQIKTNKFLLTEVEKAERRCRKNGVPVTSGKVIAEQTLGFWTDLFEVYHYKILLGRPIQIFPNLPSGIGRRDVSDELNKIRLFRNRINHNEPVCFKGVAIDFTDAIEAYTSITKILEWIDPALLPFIKNLDKVKKIIIAAKKI